MKVTRDELAALRPLLDDIHFQDLDQIKFLYLFHRSYEESESSKPGKQIFIVCQDDQVYGHGTNEWGILGIGDSEPITNGIPKRIPHLSNRNIIDFASGYGHVLALTADGIVLSWGWNNGSFSYFFHP